MAQRSFVDRLSDDRPLLLDGGLATELEAQGHDLAGALWSARLLRSDPDAIVRAHRAFLDAGADVVISASYQASRAGFHQLGVDAAAADRLIASSVELARRAIREYEAANPGSGPHYAAASVGPYGAVLADGSEYTGDYGVPPGVLKRFHAERLALLDAAGADVLACETVPSHDEAAVLAALLEDVETPAWVSFCCRDGEHIADGTPLAEAAALFRAHPRVVALGVNCTAPSYVDSLIRVLRQSAPEKAIAVYPNSGERYAACDNTWLGDAEAADIATPAITWREAGATLIGGCCRVTPADVGAIGKALAGRPA